MERLLTNHEQIDKDIQDLNREQLKQVIHNLAEGLDKLESEIDHIAYQDSKIGFVI